MVPRKLVLIIVDGLAPDTLATAVASGAAPNLGMLVERGGLGQAVSTFPSLTPVCLSTIATGAGPDQTRIPALQWYHRGEQRFVEYGSSFQATLVEGAKQSVDDAVVNLNHVHLSPKLRTLFELVEDAGMVAASVNFPIWRGRVRHSFKYPMLARFARRTGFMDAAYGPSQFYFGELFATERTGAPTSLGVGGRNDANAAAVGRWLVARDGFDFLLFYLPETDSAGHKGGDALRPAAVAGADEAVATLMSAAGGVEPFLERYAVVLCADHGQSPIDRDDDVRDAFARHAPVPRARAHRPERVRSGRRRLQPGGARLPARQPDTAATRSASACLHGPRSTSQPGARTGTPSCATRATSCGSRRTGRCTTPVAARGRSRATARPSSSRATARWSRRRTRTRSNASGRSSAA